MSADSRQGWSSDRWRALPTVLRILGVVAIAFAIMRIAAVAIAGIVTNDSLGYLRRAPSPFSDGLVVQGYRQAGYPVFLNFASRWGDLLGWDQIFGVALLQRALLCTALGGLIWAARWWSAPTVLIATSASYVLLVDFVLAEGLIVPLCLISGALLTATTYRRVPARAASIALVSSSLVALVAGAIKLQFAALLAVTAAMGWVLVRDALCSRRLVAGVLIVSSLLIGGLVVAQAMENERDLGTVEPIAERHRSMWWGAWQAVFALDPANRTDPDLAEFYDGGNLYTFLHGIENDGSDYETRKRLTEERTSAMLDAAGTTLWKERTASFLGALRGGRSDDLAGITRRTLDLAPGDATGRLQPNQLAQTEGVAAVVTSLNDGHPPGIVTTGPVLDPAQRVISDYRDWMRWLSPISILVLMAAAIFGRRERAAAIGVLVMTIACAGAMASGFTDNARYLIGPLSVALIAATNAVREFVLDDRPRRFWQSATSHGTNEVSDSTDPECGGSDVSESSGNEAERPSTLSSN